MLFLPAPQRVICGNNFNFGGNGLKEFFERPDVITGLVITAVLWFVVCILGTYAAGCDRDGAEPHKR